MIGFHPIQSAKVLEENLLKKAIKVHLRRLDVYLSTQDIHLGSQDVYLSG